MSTFRCATLCAADVAVARRALDLGPDVRRMVEPDVRLRWISEHALPGEVAPACCICVIWRMRGRFVATVRWQPIHVRTLGSPATGPSETVSWQYSVHAISRPTWMLCGNSNGCSTTTGWRPRKSLSAARKCRMRGREDVRRLPGQQCTAGGAGHVPFEKAATKAARQRHDQDEAETCEHGTDEAGPHRAITSWLPAWVPGCE